MMQLEAVILRALCAALRAALDLAAGGGTTVELNDSSPVHAVLEVRWRP